MLLSLVQPVPPFPGVDLTSSKVTNVKNENQRLRNELDDIRRRFQGLDSRNSFFAENSHQISMSYSFSIP